MRFVIQGLKYDEEAKSLLMRYAPDIYETEFEKIPEA